MTVEIKPGLIFKYRGIWLRVIATTELNEAICFRVERPSEKRVSFGEIYRAIEEGYYKE